MHGAMLHSGERVMGKVQRPGSPRPWAGSRSANAVEDTSVALNVPDLHGGHPMSSIAWASSSSSAAARFSRR
jgi:hypothetical protein